MRRLVRPYSAGLFLLSIPAGYGLFVSILILLLMIVNRTYIDISDGIFVFSIWYAASCYIWIPVTWLMLSAIGSAVTKRHNSERPQPQA